VHGNGQLIHPAALDRLGTQSCLVLLEKTSNTFTTLPGSCYGPLLPNQNPSPVRAAHDRCFGNYNFTANYLLQLYDQQDVAVLSICGHGLHAVRLPLHALGARLHQASVHRLHVACESTCGSTLSISYPTRAHSLCVHGCAAKVNQMRPGDV